MLLKCSPVRGVQHSRLAGNLDARIWMSQLSQAPPMQNMVQDYGSTLPSPIPATRQQETKLYR